MDAFPACVDFDVITFFKVLFIQFMGEYVRFFFLQLSARNIHLLSRYPAAGEYGGPQLGLDNIYTKL